MFPMSRVRGNVGKVYHSERKRIELLVDIRFEVSFAILFLIV